MKRYRFGPILAAFLAPVPVVDPPTPKRDLSISIEAVHTDAFPASVVFRPEAYRGAEAEVTPLKTVHFVTFPAGTFPPTSPEQALATAATKYSVDVSANVDGDPVEVRLLGLTPGETYQGLSILEDEV